MYIATRELELQNRKAKPGDQVPEVLAWSYPVLLAHLNMGWIKYVGEEAEVVIPDEHQPSEPTLLNENQEIKASEDKSPIEIPEDSKPTQVVNAKGEFVCIECGKTFKTERALKIHVTTAHKK
jgi:hypothetical protein